MFAAVKIYQDFNRSYPPRVEQYGLRLVANSQEECKDYISTHRGEFLEMHGNCFPAVVSFDPNDFPRTMFYHRSSPSLHICAYEDAEGLAGKIVSKGF